MRGYFLKPITLFLILSCISGIGAAQTYRFKGKVLDVKTQEPIPFAHCKLLNDSKGFVTDLDGQFRYESDQERLEVLVSSIGYTNAQATLLAKENNIILLQADAQVLMEVVVTYVDHERELLQKVLDNIPQNYPQQDERITGKVMEQLAQDSLYQDLIYSATSNIEADKLTYGNKNTFSTVKILDGEVEFIQPMDSSFTKIYGGVHNLHRFDIIAARMEPFDKIQKKDYRFELVDTISYQGSALFKMKFDTDSYTGYLYIQDGTFALLKGEYRKKEHKLDSWFRGSYRLFLSFTTEYFPEDSLFRIGYINYQTGFSETDASDAKKVYLNNFFYLEEAQETQDLIPYNEQTNFSDILINEIPTKQLSPTDTTALGAIISRKPEKRLVDYLRDFSFSYELGILYNQFSTTSFQHTSLGIDARIEPREILFLLYNTIEYSFSNSFRLVYSGGTSFKRNQIESNILLARYITPLNKNRRFLLGLQGGINYLTSNLDLQNQVTTSGGNFGGQLFSEGTLTLKERTTQFNVATGLQLKYRIGNRTYLTFTGDVGFSLNHQSRIQGVQGEIASEIFRTTTSYQFNPVYYQGLLGLHTEF